MKVIAPNGVWLAIMEFPTQSTSQMQIITDYRYLQKINYVRITLLFFRTER